MKQTYLTDKHSLRLTRITFWVYLLSVPIILLVFAIPYLQGKPFEINLFHLIYLGIVGYLAYQAYKLLRVILAMKRTRCSVTEDTVSGYSIPNPMKKGEAFSIARDEILGIGKKHYSIGTLRSLDILLLNTKEHTYALLSVDKMDALKQELQKDMKEE